VVRVGEAVVASQIEAFADICHDNPRRTIDQNGPDAYAVILERD
jgi:hypothetical protein